MRREDFDVWFHKFEPNIELDGTIKLYHWAGEDVHALNAVPTTRVWTLIDGSNGKLYVAPGKHFVNRLNYIICKNEWKEGQRDYLYG